MPVVAMLQLPQIAPALACHSRWACEPSGLTLCQTKLNSGDLFKETTISMCYLKFINHNAVKKPASLLVARNTPKMP